MLGAGDEGLIDLRENRELPEVWGADIKPKKRAFGGIAFFESENPRVHP